jgi:hypothetical protein
MQGKPEEGPQITQILHRQHRLRSRGVQIVFLVQGSGRKKGIFFIDKVDDGR